VRNGEVVGVGQNVGNTIKRSKSFQIRCQVVTKRFGVGEQGFERRKWLKSDDRQWRCRLRPECFLMFFFCFLSYRILNASVYNKCVRNSITFFLPLFLFNIILTMSDSRSQVKAFERAASVWHHFKSGNQCDNYIEAFPMPHIAVFVFY